MKDFIKNINARVLLIIILAFLLGWQMGHRDVAVKWANFKPSISIVNKQPPSNINVDFRLFWDTWNLLYKSYLGKKDIDPNKLFYGAISGMVASLGDPYTVFLPPEQQKITKQELGGSFDGVGIELGYNDKSLVVVAPLAGNPAEKAGIKAKDIIAKIDGKDTIGLNLPEAVQKIRGIKGTKVKLSILRPGEQQIRDFELVRDTIIVRSVEVNYQNTKSGKKVAIIKLSRFGERTNDEWQQAVSDLISKNAQKVILDMRNNPGGFLEGAVYIGSEFLDEGDIVLQENSEGVRSSYKVNRVGRLTNMPLEILINKGSASASEIVAGAMQDRKRAQLIGEKSFGKGTIQEVEELDGVTGLHITVAKWLTPNGRWVNDTQGFEPDVKIDADSKDLPASQRGEPDGQVNDKQLQKALELFE